MATVDQLKTGTRRWRVRWTDPNTHRRETRTYLREDDARQVAMVLRAAQGDTERAERAVAAINKKSHTVTMVVLDHIERRKNAIGPDTADRYRAQVRDHIAATNIGSLAVDSLGYGDLTEWLQDRVDAGLATKTIRNIHGLLSAAMTTATHLSLVPRNPCSGYPLPRSSAISHQRRALDQSEIGALIAAMPAHYRTLVKTLVATGCRWGEITALTVGDLDLRADPPTIRVEKAWKRGANGAKNAYVGAPKTRRAFRTISIPRELGSELLENVTRRKASRTDFLFVNMIDARIDQRTFWGTIWNPAIERAMNPTHEDGSADLTAPALKTPATVHDLRHTHGSQLLAAGLPMLDVSRRLGHESITTTANIYGHTMTQHQKQAADIVSKMLSGAPAPATDVER